MLWYVLTNTISMSNQLPADKKTTGWPGDDAEWRDKWMAGTGTAVYPHVAIKTLQAMAAPDNISSDLLAAALHAYPAERGIYVEGREATPEAQQAISVVARATAILDGLFPLRHPEMTAKIEQGVGAEVLQRLCSQAVGGFDYNSQIYTFYRQPPLVVREALLTQLHLPLNLIAVAASMAPEGLPPIATSLADLARILREPWFAGVIGTAARTGNGFWRAFSTQSIFLNHVMADVRSAPRHGHALSFTYNVGTDGRTTFAFSAEAERVLHGYRRERNREARDEGNALGTTAGCPAARLQPHFANEAEAAQAAWTLDTTVGAVRARAERTAIHEGNLIIADLIDRAAALEQAGA